MKQGCLIVIGLIFLSAFSLKGQEAALLIDLESDTLLCNGLSNGEFSFTVNGGTPPYHYEWVQLGNSFVFDQGDIEVEGDTQVSGGNLAVGGYVLEVIDVNGVKLKDTSFVVAPYPIYISDFITVQPSCVNACDGSLSLGVGGGTGEISITWADIEDTTSLRPGLCAGSYTFFLEDENGCSQKGLADIYDPEPILAESLQERPSCLGLSDGSLMLSNSGGNAPYTISWDDGGDGDTLEDLNAGEYHVLITDINSCVLDTFFILEDGVEIIPNVQINYGCGDGNIIAVAQPINAEEPYEINWSTGLAGDIIYGVSAGDFSLTLTDANNCTTNSDFIIDFVPPLELSEQISQVSCPGSNDGWIDVSISGGLPPFTFSWSHGSEDQNIDGLEGGIYTINVIAEGCARSESYYVPEPTPLSVEIIYESQENGLLSATAIIGGGTPPYQLEWNTGSTEANVEDLTSGTNYSLFVSDQMDCAETFDFEALLTSATSVVKNSNALVYPNPTSNYINIDFLGIQPQHVLLDLYDMKGAHKFTHNAISELTIVKNITDLPSGVYILRLSYDNRVETRKIVKN